MLTGNGVDEDAHHTLPAPTSSSAELTFRNHVSGRSRWVFSHTSHELRGMVCGVMGQMTCGEDEWHGVAKDR